MTTATQSILVTRPNPEGALLCAAINAAGGCALHYPTIAIAPPPSPTLFEQSLSALKTQDAVIFISPQAVYASRQAIAKQQALPAHMPLFAIGAGTASALQAAGFSKIIYPAHDWSSEGLLALPSLQNICQQKIALIQGHGGREHLQQTLRARGAHVLAVIAYQRVLPQPVAPLQQKKIATIVCTSGDSLRHLQHMVDEITWSHCKKIPLLVTAERIKMLAEDLGFQTIWVASNASHEAILNALRKGKKHDR